MQKLLSELEKEFNLNLGDKKFSPIMKCTIGLSMKYQEEVKKGFKQPFHLNFPDKRDGALWISVALMRNYLLEDYINQPTNRIVDLGIKVGDKVEIFGAVAKYVGDENNKILLEFSDQYTPISISDKLTSYINLSKKSKINKYRIFRNNYNLQKKNRNPISKLIEPNEPILINPKILDSKVLVIAGRGNTVDFSNQLKNEYIYGSTLSDVFGSGENLIIKPDLEDFTFLSEEPDDNLEKKFKHHFLNQCEKLVLEKPEIKENLYQIMKLVLNNDFRSNHFLELYDDVLDEVQDDSPLSLIKEKYFPGIKYDLPENLKAVVINDINQLTQFENIINKFLEYEIPVIVISNRYANDIYSISFFDNYFKTHPNDLKLNWNKPKIASLSTLDTLKTRYLDDELWKKCLRFSNQIIEIKTSTNHPLDELVIDLQKKVAQIDGQERLKKVYWQFFNPLIYSFKNGNEWEPYHDVLLNKFQEVYNQVDSTLDVSITDIFSNIFSVFRNTKSNFKSIYKCKNVFTQKIAIDEENYIFPDDSYVESSLYQIDGNADEITFTGFPINELFNKNLINSISEFIVPNINIICWPKEGEITYSYIKRRIKAGYFLDLLPHNWNFNQNLLISSNSDIENEIDSAIITDYKNSEIILENTKIDEDAIEKISSFKYSEYKNYHLDESLYIVKCNIIDFAGNKFMFLPQNSTVLAKIETQGNNFIFRRAKFIDLNIGDEIFQYELPRQTLRSIAKSIEGSDIIFNYLDTWKKSLYDIYQELDYNIYKVVNKLNKVNQKLNFGGNPSYQNVRNWLFDEDMHAPSENNLKMILNLDSNHNTTLKASDILTAATAAKSLSQRISRLIKNAITYELNDSLQPESDIINVKIFETNIAVNFSKIVLLQKSEIEIEYQHTRKIIS